MRRRTGFSRAGAHFLVWEEDAKDGTAWAAELAAAEQSLAKLLRGEREALPARPLPRAVDRARRVTQSG